ncbi:MAG: hypothetical protein ABEL76_09605 [Bradymonadaceae bacterium]
MSETGDNRGEAGGTGWIRSLLSFESIGGWSAEQRRALTENARHIRSMFVERRSPRLALVGARDLGVFDVLGAAFADVPSADDAERKEYLGHGRWHDYEMGCEELSVLDVRRGHGDRLSLKALDEDVPDVVILVWPADDRGRQRTLDDYEKFVRAVRVTGEIATPTVAVFDNRGRDESAREMERDLRDRLGRTAVPEETLAFVALTEGESLAEELVWAAPAPARLSLARASRHPGPKRRAAEDLIQTSAGLAATFAAAPLPVADIVPITGVQVAMIASLAHLGGRDFSLTSVGEFVFAAGLNVGAGYAARAVARTLMGLVPAAGAVISTGMATTATAGLGRAAAAYFFDREASVPEVAGEQAARTGGRVE